jgi:hypothetical protein
VLRRGFVSHREFLDVARAAFLAPEALLPSPARIADLQF